MHNYSPGMFEDDIPGFNEEDEDDSPRRLASYEDPDYDPNN